MDPVPVYELYGEDEWVLGPDQVHCETIASRSDRYNWKIAPHRHNGLYQLLLLESGTATLRLDADVSRIAGPTLVAIPPPTIHAFAFDPPVTGYVIMVPMFVAMNGAEHSVHPTLSVDRPGTMALPRSSEALRTLSFVSRQIHREVTAMRPGRPLVLDSLVKLLFLFGGRSLQACQVEGEHAHAGNRIARFYDLVDRHYASGRSVAAYADELAVSTVRLNRILQVSVAKSALEIIHDRLLLEAKRRLVYTPLDIGQVAHELGFSDPAYFARFFRRKAGCSPSAFRSDALEALKDQDTATRRKGQPESARTASNSRD